MKAVSVEAAPLAAKPQIGSMLSAYLAELGVGEPYQYFHQYWVEPGHRYPFLIRHHSGLAGFALVRHVERFEMAEFYIVPGFRRAGIGRFAVEELVRKFTGLWVIRAFPGNERALLFWRSALRSHCIKHLVEGSEGERVVFTFESLGAR
ncbi:GNAT family N-acetyltransferase [Acaryochloris sp. IP29b_bin.137]|uniref:GNAT family N-acetyltransferase n=1 Tax=Acaryochloris sp. IP29b_bin.137 TaxID=2969217 RepID=UPI0026326CF9|nr:GNAT family N-acetyltransferase [Acaryochloris sp. IP29b_bin.137]